jgi:hypothetical protein
MCGGFGDWAIGRLGDWTIGRLGDWVIGGNSYHPIAYHPISNHLRFLATPADVSARGALNIAATKTA